MDLLVLVSFPLLPYVVVMMKMKVIDVAEDNCASLMMVLMKICVNDEDDEGVELQLMWIMITIDDDL